MKQSRAADYLKSLFKMRGPAFLTGRSTVILLGLAYLLWGPVQGRTDIVSAALAFGLLTIVVLILALVITQGVIIRKSVTVQVTPPDEGLVSKYPARIVLSTTPVRILPFTYFDVTVEFDQPGVTPATLRLKGFRLAERRSAIDITFPHRGAWNIRGLTLQVGDIAKLTRYSWRVALEAAPRVYPREIRDNSLPVLSSSQRPGELVVDTLNRQGDPFDIKPYHPTDGVRRIVWKAFAKRGELLSRHPEASMTPEGYVVMMALAGPNDDDVCARVHAYMSFLEELKLDLLFGCEGQAGRSFATTAESARGLLVDSVWDAANSTPATLRNDATALLDFCASEAPSARISKLVLFCSGTRLADPSQQDLLQSFATWLSLRGISPVLCVNPLVGTNQLKRPRLASKAAQWFKLREEKTHSAVSSKSYSDFMAACLERQWEVYV